MIILFSAKFESSEKPEILGLYNSQEEFDSQAPQIFENRFNNEHQWQVDVFGDDYLSCSNKTEYVQTIMISLNEKVTVEDPNEDNYWFFKENHECI